MCPGPWDIDANEVADLAGRLVRCSSPNPPGDVNRVAHAVRSYLDQHGLHYRVDRRASDRLNLVCTIDSGVPGNHVVLSGHLDTFPLTAERVSRGRPGRDRAGVVRGRGVADMKGGVAGALVGLTRIAATDEKWRGRVSIVLVCDEETFGVHGARQLLLDRSLLDVDAVLTAEPSGRARIRYGERGPVWGVFVFRGSSGHAGYPQSGRNPIERAAELIAPLRADFERAFARHREASSADHEPPGLSLTVSTVRGGTKINIHPGECHVEVDVRVPPEVSASDVADWMAQRAKALGGEYRPVLVEDANVSDPTAPAFSAMAEAVREELGTEPTLEIARGSTDGRHWRRIGVPVAQYGADPLMQATVDEHVAVDELGEIARVHARTAWSLLTKTN